MRQEPSPVAGTATNSANPASEPPRRPIDTSDIFPPGLWKKAYRHLQPAVESLFGFSAIWSRYDACRGDNPDAVTFSRRFLEASGVEVAIEAGLPEKLGAVQGPLVIASNHPFGGMEFFALVGLLEAIRPGGWNFLANPAVSRVPGLQDSFIPLDPLNPTAALNRRGLARAARVLQTGGLLGLFPAGRVSHRERPNCAITDLPWSDHAVRLAADAGAGIAVLHIPGSNSSTFLKVPPRWAHFRALMLARELARPTVSRLEIQLARLVAPGEVEPLARSAAPGRRLQAWCQLRSDADSPRPETAPVRSARQNGVEQDPVPELREAVNACTDRQRICQSGPFDLLLVRGEDAPELLHELGRLREVTFRAAGQGTGRDIDLSPEDNHYHHLLLWHREAGKIGGAYRIGIVRDILEEQGGDGLYLNHVFNIRPAFFERIGPPMELSRSFVIPAYQRDNRALAALWKGLGTAATRHGIRTLFGSVTISNRHHPASRALLVEHLRRNYADSPEMRRLIQPRHPFVPATGHHGRIASAYAGESIDKLAPLIEHLENGQRGIPPLIRYYCTLGARFLSYHVEPAFADALYCLLRVDLPSLPDGYRKRFLEAD